MFTSITVTDDRGTRVAMRVLDGSVLWPVDEDPRVQSLVTRMDLVWHKQISGRRWMVIASVLYTVAFTFIMVAARPWTSALPTWMWALGAALIAAPMFIAMGRRMARRAADDIVALILSEGLCPACGYNFVGLAPQSDECVECPECGAAWRAASIERTAPFAAEPRALNVRGSLSTIINRLDAGVLHTDDRGRQVRLVRPQLRRILRRAEGEHRERLLAARRAYTGRRARFLTAGFFLSIAGLSALVIMMIGWRTVGIGGLIWMGIWTALAVGVLFGNFGYRRQAIVAAMKEEELCPACGSDLRAAAVEDDGCRVCALCRAAWRV